MHNIFLLHLFEIRKKYNVAMEILDRTMRGLGQFLKNVIKNLVDNFSLPNENESYIIVWIIYLDFRKYILSYENIFKKSRFFNY